MDEITRGLEVGGIEVGNEMKTRKPILPIHENMNKQNIQFELEVVKRGMSHDVATWENLQFAL